MGVKNNIALIFKYLILNLKKEAQYKTAFTMQIVMMILNDLFFILQWVIIFSVTETIGGYGFREIMLLWAISAGSYGVSHLLFYGAFDIGGIVYDGKLDVFLTQPKNVLINVSCSKCSVPAIGDIAYTFVALAIAGASWWWYLAIIPVIIVGGVIYASIVVCFQTISFYIKKGDAIANMIDSAVTLFSTYPPVIFNAVAKIFLFTIIPVGFICFVPTQYIFLGFNIWWILGSVGFEIVVTFLAFFLFRLGLKKYNSGNLMGGRL